jgi:hypothetical protein
MINLNSKKGDYIMEYLVTDGDIKEYRKMMEDVVQEFDASSYRMYSSTTIPPNELDNIVCFIVSVNSPDNFVVCIDDKVDNVCFSYTIDGYAVDVSLISNMDDIDNVNYRVISKYMDTISDYVSYMFMVPVYYKMCYKCGSIVDKRDIYRNTCSTCRSEYFSNYYNNKKDNVLTVETLKNIFTYKNGNLVYRNDYNKYKEGDIAGTPCGDGYVGVYINGKQYYLHHLVWMYHKGYFPKMYIDHINDNKKDNRIENLQETTQSENIRAARRINQSTGITGVYKKNNGKYYSLITTLGKTYYLGSYNTLIEAVMARLHGEETKACVIKESPAMQYYKSFINNKENDLSIIDNFMLSVEV